jgi:predicted secreted protein
MARLVGYGGCVKVATNTIAGIRAWSLDQHVEAIETTGFDSSGKKVFTPGISEWSGSFEGFKDGAPLTIGSEVALELQESATATQKHTGQAIITDFHPSNSVDGVVLYSYDFQGTSTLTIATA